MSIYILFTIILHLYKKMLNFINVYKPYHILKLFFRLINPKIRMGNAHVRNNNLSLQSKAKRKRQSLIWRII